MQKAALRWEMLRKRQRYLPEEVTRRSEQICRNFFNYFAVEHFKLIHVFLPIISKKEVDTWLLVEQLRRNHPTIALAVPVTDPTKQILTHYLLTPETRLLSNPWGIPEPQGAAPIIVSDIDMVVVPLIAFDAKGHRVGYGKGYYDRFLALCRSDTVTVGLSLEEPGPDISDVHAGDRVLQYVVTPHNVFKFN